MPSPRDPSSLPPSVLEARLSQIRRVTAPGLIAVSVGCRDGHCARRLAQRQILRELGVAEDRIYLDYGLTGRNRSRPGLNNALTALRGETPWWYQSRTDSLASAKGWQSRANGRLKGKTPKLSRTQRTVLVKLHQAGDHTIAELAELFSVSRATVCREIARAD